MDEEHEQRTDDGEEWPLPSGDVLRELELSAIVWSEQEWLVSQPLHPIATG